MPVVDGIAQPGIVEKLYISGDTIKFRNYSVDATLDLGAIGTPVSVKWGVRDNHFFVQTGTGASAIFRIYTLDRAAEGAVYQPGIIPTATLVKTLPMSALNVTVCTATFNFSKDATQVYGHEIVTAVFPQPPGTTTYAYETLERDNNSSVVLKTIAFILNQALLTTPNAFGGTGTVSAGVNTGDAVLDGDLNLLVPFTMTWTNWQPFTNAADPLTYAGDSYVAASPVCLPTGAPFDQLNSMTPHLTAYLFNEIHAVVVNLGLNTRVYSTLPITRNRNAVMSGRNLDVFLAGGDFLYGLQTFVNAPTTCLTGGFTFNTPYSVGILDVAGQTTRETYLYADSFAFASVAGTVENVDVAKSITTGNVQGSWTRRDVTQRWRLRSDVVPLAGKRSSGPISGNLIAAVLHVQQVPTNAIAAWATDVTKDGWFLLRGAGLVLSTTLRAMQASAPTVTLRSFNSKYLLWSIPGFVYRTTLTTGDTVQVGTDATKFTSRSLALIHPVYLYSQAETNDDEGIEGHFFVDIENVPLPTTDLPVTGSLVKWEMFNPVDDLKHL